VSNLRLNELKKEVDLGTVEWPRMMLDRLPRPMIEAEEAGGQ
jgi:hypothetical protein